MGDSTFFCCNIGDDNISISLRENNSIIFSYIDYNEENMYIYVENNNYLKVLDNKINLFDLIKNILTNKEWKGFEYEIIKNNCVILNIKHYLIQNIYNITMVKFTDVNEEIIRGVSLVKDYLKNHYLCPISKNTNIFLCVGFLIGKSMLLIIDKEKKSIYTTKSWINLNETIIQPSKIKEICSISDTILGDFFVVPKKIGKYLYDKEMLNSMKIVERSKYYDLCVKLHKSFNIEELLSRRYFYPIKFSDKKSLNNLYQVIFTKKGNYYKMKDNVLIDRKGNHYRNKKYSDEIIATVPLINSFNDNEQNTNVWIIGGELPNLKNTEYCSSHGNNCPTCDQCNRYYRVKHEIEEKYDWLRKHNIGIGEIMDTI
jgi:hypothetical protein